MEELQSTISWLFLFRLVLPFPACITKRLWLDVRRARCSEIAGAVQRPLVRTPEPLLALKYGFTGEQPSHRIPFVAAYLHLFPSRLCTALRVATETRGPTRQLPLIVNCSPFSLFPFAISLRDKHPAWLRAHVAAFDDRTGAHLLKLSDGSRCKARDSGDPALPGSAQNTSYWSDSACAVPRSDASRHPGFLCPELFHLHAIC